MKIIGVGAGKTGTTTLGTCLRHWGLNNKSFDAEAVALWHKGKYEDLLTWVNEYDSFDDWPWALLYKEVDRKYKGSKFILTRRKDSETWYKSLCRHANRVGPDGVAKYIYGYESPYNHKQQHIQFYEDHNKAVRSYFRDRPNDLLEVCWEDGDGWDELSRFLGFEKPNIPFPHIHKSSIAGKLRSEIRLFLSKIY